MHGRDACINAAMHYIYSNRHSAFVIYIVNCLFVTLYIRMHARARQTYITNIHLYSCGGADARFHCDACT